MTTLIKILLCIGFASSLQAQQTSISAEEEISMSQANASSKDGTYRYYKNGESKGFTGILYTKYNNGNYLTRQEYKDGLGEGTWINYWPNGNLKEVGAYQKNKVEGPITKYNQNGDMIAKGHYKDWRIRVRHWKYYDDDGNLIKTENYGSQGDFRDVEDFYQKGEISEYRYKQLKNKFLNSK